MTARKKMCANKDTFWSRERAEASAARWGHRVYECPICFCWHCTSKADWRQDFVDPEVMRVELARQETRLRTEFNAKLKEKNMRIMELEKALSQATDAETE